MRHLPRALNRFLLFLIGLLFIAAGAGLLLVAYWNEAKEPFTKVTGQISEGYQRVHDQSLVAIPGLPEQDFSWLTIGWVAIAIILVVLLLMWIFSQGGGKVKELNLFGRHHQETDDRGEIVARVSFVEDLIRDALDGNRWIADVKTTAWDVKKQPGISLAVIAYKGADLGRLKESIDQAVARVDSALGNPVPVVVHLTTNWRTTFQSADRVDNQ